MPAIYAITTWERAICQISQSGSTIRLWISIACSSQYVLLPNKGVAADERGRADWLKLFRFARGLSRRASFDAFGAARAPVGVVASDEVAAGARS